MSQRLEIDILPCDEAAEVTCPLCGESLCQSSIAGLLYDGGQPLGCVCEKCLTDDPKQVAERLHERVADLDDFIQRADRALAGELWGERIDRVRRRAQHWHDLAKRIEALDEWPIRERACC